MKTLSPLPIGTVARCTIQCIHPETGEKGDWLFIGDSHRTKESSCSPVFTDRVALHLWAMANGWESVKADYRLVKRVQTTCEDWV